MYRSRESTVKHLPKYLQPRWRYVAVLIEAWPDADFDRDAFQRALWYSAQNLVGDTGSADLDLSVLEFRFADGSGEAIIRTRRGAVRHARAAIACVDAVDGAVVGLRVPGVSGTVRTCEEKYMGHRPETPEERTVVFDNAERSGYVRDDRADVGIGEAFIGATTADVN